MMSLCEAGIPLGGANVEMLSPVWDMLTYMSRWNIQVESECMNIHTEQMCSGGSDQCSLDFIPALKPLVIPSLDDSELFGLTKALTTGFSHISHWTGSG